MEKMLQIRKERNVLKETGILSNDRKEGRKVEKCPRQEIKGENENKKERRKKTTSKSSP